MSGPAEASALTAAQRKRQQAPAIPDGWTTGAPDFIGVGAHKSGTTWWWALLSKHPEIDVVPRRKELHLLEHMREQPIPDEQREWYYRQFPRAPGHITGEWTTRYMTMPPMPGIIEGVAPRAKLLAMVRDPIDRYVSGITQWDDQTRRRGRKRDEKSGKREALKRGFYGRQIERLIEAVGGDRMLVLQFERCVQDPEAEYARTCEFLGVSAYAPDHNVVHLRYNPTMAKKLKLSAKERAALKADYDDEVRLLKRLVPDLDLTLWPEFSNLAAS